MSADDWWFVAKYILFVILLSGVAFALIYYAWGLEQERRFQSYETTMDWVNEIRDEETNDV